MSDLWDPKLKIQNLEEIKGGRDEKWHTIKLGDKDPIVIYRRRLKGSFYENMELKDFPRDVQVNHKVYGWVLWMFSMVRKRTVLTLNINP